MSTVTIGSLCSGYGGLDGGLTLALGGNARTAWHVEYDKHPSAILAHRYPGVPNYGDVTTTDWTSVEPIDWITAGFPCQDVSHAGKRAGLREGTRTGIWSHVARAIDTLRPRGVLLENVGGLLSAGADSDVEPCPWCLGDGQDEPPLRALGAVLADLADIGYDARWRVVRASDAGAPHGRARVFVIANPSGETRRLGDGDGLPVGVGRDDAAWGEPEHRGATALADADRQQPQGVGSLPRLGRGPDARRGLRDVWAEPAAGLVGGPDAAECGDDAATDARSLGLNGRAGQQGAWGESPVGGQTGSDAGDRVTSWGAYGPAVARWERVIGRPAPRPTEPGRSGERLSPRFVEWLMGLPDGWVTDVPGIPRNAQLKALGNGVVPQQAALACRLLGVTSAREVAA